MTNEEFNKLTLRVLEITETLEVCDPTHDQDVIQNLLEELEEMSNILTKSVEEDYDTKPRLRLVKEDE